MSIVPEILKRNSLAFFLALVFLGTWLIIAPLFPDNAGVGLIVFLPTLAALIAAALLDGKAGLRELWRRVTLWRVGWRWYLIALILPIIIHLIVAGLAMLQGETLAMSFDIFILNLIFVLIFATAEEIGWTGYALPRLMKKWSASWVMLIFGFIHAAFHLPFYLLPLPEELRQAAPLPLFVIMAIAFVVFRIWLYQNTEGSVVIAIVYHVAINASVVLVMGISREMQGWLLPTVWSIAALIFFVGYYRPLMSKAQMQAV